MTPIHVELPCAREAASLIEFLSEHGLAGAVATTDDHCDVEVAYAVDPDELLRREFESALAQWLATLPEPLVPATNREHAYILRPPGD